MNDGAGVFIAVVVIVTGGVLLMVVAMNNRRRLLEAAYRERVAMIERGLVPAPERDPGAFEAGTGLATPRPSLERAERYRTAGVIFIGLGVGLAVLLGFAAGVPDIGIGVGGSWAVLGAALLLNYFLMTRGTHGPIPPANWHSPQVRGRSEPPPNTGP